MPLFTSDGPTDVMLTGGTLTGAWATVNFGSRATESFDVLKRHRPLDPPMCMEFWCGWFDHWGGPHHTRSADDAAATLTEIIDAGASVNIFMAHGGTSFGPYAGANHGDTDRRRRPDPAPTSRPWAATTTTHRSARQASSRRSSTRSGNSWSRSPPPRAGRCPSRRPTCLARRRSRCGSTRPGEWPCARSWPTLAEPVESVTVEPMETFGQAYGSIHYATTLNLHTPISTVLRLDGLADRAHVFVDGVLVGVVDRRDEAHVVPVDLPAGSVEVEILVEATGRVNYGPHLADRKGLTGVRLGPPAAVRLARAHAGAGVGAGARARAVPGSRPTRPWSARCCTSWRSTSTAPADAFVALPGHGHSRVWLNGFDLGLLRPEGTTAHPVRPRTRSGGQVPTRSWCSRPAPSATCCCSPTLPTSADPSRPASTGTRSPHWRLAWTAPSSRCG